MGVTLDGLLNELAALEEVAAKRADSTPQDGEVLRAGLSNVIGRLNDFARRVGRAS